MKFLLISLCVGLAACEEHSSATSDAVPPTPIAVWVDNDDHRDTYLSELAMAAASAGKITLHGLSTTTSTATDGYNRHVTAADAAAFGAGHVQERTHAKLSGFQADAIPTPSAVYSGQLAKPESGRIGDTKVLKLPSARQLLATALAHGSPARPLNVCGGGQLTIIGDAYLQALAVSPQKAAEFVSKVRIWFAGGWTGNARGYNEWADGWAMEIVCQLFDVRIFPIESHGLGNGPPVVPKSKLATHLPASPLREAMRAKNHPSNGLPAERDADGLTLLMLLEPAYVRSWSRHEVSGSEISDGHGVPKLTAKATGNVWYASAIDQKAGTAKWWEIMSNPSR